MAKSIQPPSEQVRTHRIARKMSVRAFARQLDVSASTLSAIEGGSPPATMRVAQTLRDVCGVALDSWPLVTP